MHILCHTKAQKQTFPRTRQMEDTARRRPILCQGRPSQRRTALVEVRSGTYPNFVAIATHRSILPADELEEPTQTERNTLARRTLVCHSRIVNMGAQQKARPRFSEHTIPGSSTWARNRKPVPVFSYGSSTWARNRKPVPVFASLFSCSPPFLCHSTRLAGTLRATLSCPT